MIRHVSISAEDNVIAGKPCFAWFDTVTESFCEFSGNQAWETWEDFERDWSDEPGDKRGLARFKGLFPTTEGQHEDR